jgi:hypothetical protein
MVYPVFAPDLSIYHWFLMAYIPCVVFVVCRSAVTAVSWHPDSSFLASVDKTKKAIVWGDV